LLSDFPASHVSLPDGISHQYPIHIPSNHIKPPSICIPFIFPLISPLRKNVEPLQNPQADTALGQMRPAATDFGPAVVAPLLQRESFQHRENGNQAGKKFKTPTFKVYKNIYIYIHIYILYNIM